MSEQDDNRAKNSFSAKDGGRADPEFFVIFNIGLVVGGSITIPHLRRAVDRLDGCRKQQKRRHK